MKDSNNDKERRNKIIYEDVKIDDYEEHYTDFIQIFGKCKIDKIVCNFVYHAQIWELFPLKG